MRARSNLLRPLVFQRRRGEAAEMSARSMAALLSFSVWALLGCSGGEAEGTVPPPFAETAGGRSLGVAGSAGSASAGAAATPGTPPVSNGGGAGPAAGGAPGLSNAGGSATVGEAPAPPMLNPAPANPGGGGAPSAGNAGTGAAGATDSGSSGAPPVAGGRFGLGGASRCGAGTLAVCESFEAAALGAAAPAGWSFAGYGNRTLQVVGDESARGQRSLRVDVAANQAAVVGMLARSNLGALGQRHFGRSFLKIQAPAPTGFVHFDAFEARGNFNGQANLVRWASTGTNVGTASSNWSWIYNVQSTDHGEFGSEGPRSAHPREGDWMCLEWLMDATVQEARFWFDGAEVDYLHIDTERAEIPVFDAFNIGFQKFQQTGAWTVWVDEVAFDDQRIGCDG
jgi:hypothetical protein